MRFLYETHLHTCQGSACAVSPGREYIQPYLDLGYTGIFITDHFYGGNSVIDRNLPWREWVHRFCRGYEDAREEGVKRGLDVFFGWEETFDGDDYLVYGLEKEWLLEHPEVRGWSRLEQFIQVRRYGGSVVQAHPFRQHYYISRVVLSSGVDGVEAANRGNTDASYDALALRYAQRLALPVTAGSDLHRVSDLRSGAFYGIYMKEKLASSKDYAAAIRERAAIDLLAPPGRCDFHGTERLCLPVEFRDGNDQPVKLDIRTFLDIQ